MGNGMMSSPAEQAGESLERQESTPLLHVHPLGKGRITWHNSAQSMALQAPRLPRNRLSPT